MNNSITIEHLSKCYRIQNRRSHVVPYATLRDNIAEFFYKLWRRVLGGSMITPQLYYQDFWALQDLSCNIQQGERVGIIGRNGAGKSTLLKILSRITEPTQGRVTIHGRVASLLEVGTGFHPELTGRENVYLNGAILGMTKREIAKKFDEIVEFANIDDYLDMPVKYYSSGMYMRLAFAIPAHLTPEILLVDEVLAVGDTEFQKRCLGKMNEVAQSGRTVLFVSHNMAAIEQLCDRAICLQAGKLLADGKNVLEVTKKYLATNYVPSCWQNSGNEYLNPFFKIIKFYLGDKDGNLLNTPISNDQEMYVFLECMIEQIDPSLVIGYFVYTDSGLCVYQSTRNDTAESDWPKLQIGYNIFRSQIPSRLLNEGDYLLSVIAALHYREWILQPGYSVPSISLKIQGGLSDSPYWRAKRPGILAMICPWELKYWSATPPPSQTIQETTGTELK